MLSVQTWLEDFKSSSIKQYQAALAVTGVAGLFLFISLARFIADGWFIKNEWQLPTESATAAAHDTDFIEKAKALPKLSTWHLFGVYDPPFSGASIPQTLLNLHLLGTFVSDQAKNSSAIISSSGSPAKVYYINDTLPEGNAVLYQIQGDRVVLRFNQRYESLLLPKKSDAKTSNMSMGPSQDGNVSLDTTE